MSGFLSNHILVCARSLSFSFTVLKQCCVCRHQTKNQRAATATAPPSSTIQCVFSCCWCLRANFSRPKNVWLVRRCWRLFRKSVSLVSGFLSSHMLVCARSLSFSFTVLKQRCVRLQTSDEEPAGCHDDSPAFVDDDEDEDDHSFGMVVSLSLMTHDRMQ